MRYFQLYAIGWVLTTLFELLDDWRSGNLSEVIAMLYGIPEYRRALASYGPKQMARFTKMLMILLCSAMGAVWILWIPFQMTRRRKKKPERSTQLPDAPSPNEALFRHRLAFDLTRFVALVKALDHLAAVRAALSDSAKAQEILDAIVVAMTKPEAGKSDESIEELAQLAVTFGTTLKDAPHAALRFAQSLEGFEREAVLELSELLRHYFEFTERAAQRAQQPHGNAPSARSP